MKMLWRVMAVSLIMCMLSGCGGSLTGMGMSSPLTETDAGDSRADQESKTAETDTSGADSVETENGDNGVWGELSAESAVEGITSEDGQGTYPTYQVEIGQLSGELVKEVLLAERNISIKDAKADSWYTDQTNEFYTCQDGSYLENRFGELKFVAAEAEYWPEPFTFFQPDFRELLFPDGQDVVLTQTDWDYATMEQAKALAAGTLDKLGIEYGDEWIGFAVSGEKMTAAMHDAYPDSRYPEELVEGLSRLGKPTWKKTYDDGEDVYFFRIPQAINGHLLTKAWSIESKERAQTQGEGCYIDVMVGRTGICYLKNHHIYETTGQSESRQTITKEQAIQVAKDYQIKQLDALDPAIKTYYTYKVVEVIFSYLPSIEKDMSIKGEIIPCWEVRCEAYYGNETTPSTVRGFNVNAVTGEMISTSMGFYDLEWK